MGTQFLYHLYCLVWMSEHDCLDKCCFGRLICMRFVFLYLHLFSKIEHYGEVLFKYAHYYYYKIVSGTD